MRKDEREQPCAVGRLQALVMAGTSLYIAECGERRLGRRRGPSYSGSCKEGERERHPELTEGLQPEQDGLDRHFPTRPSDYRAGDRLEEESPEAAGESLTHSYHDSRKFC